MTCGAQYLAMSTKVSPPRSHGAAAPRCTAPSIEWGRSRSTPRTFRPLPTVETKAYAPDHARGACHAVAPPHLHRHTLTHHTPLHCPISQAAMHLLASTMHAHSRPLALAQKEDARDATHTLPPMGARISRDSVPGASEAIVRLHIHGPREFGEESLRELLLDGHLVRLAPRDCDAWVVVVDL